MDPIWYESINPNSSNLHLTWSLTRMVICSPPPSGLVSFVSDMILSFSNIDYGVVFVYYKSRLLCFVCSSFVPQSSARETEMMAGKRFFVNGSNYHSDQDWFQINAGNPIVTFQLLNFFLSRARWTISGTSSHLLDQGTSFNVITSV